MTNAYIHAPHLTSPLRGEEIKRYIQNTALAAGFDVAGFAPAVLNPTVQSGLEDFLNQGFHGDMRWMQERAQMRASPQALWPDARSVIVVGHNYAPPFDPMERLKHPANGVISTYALHRDYHDVMKKKLRALAHTLQKEFSGEFKCFVDTAPVMEKPLAATSALGWQGKHTCVVSRQFGSWLFLGEIFTTLEIAPDAPEKNHCGTCTNCLDICPTEAFNAPGKLDARKCISYLTIEHKGHIDRKFRRAIGNRIYGCDDCLAVCPWNKFARAAKESAYHPRQELVAPLLAELVQLDDAAFRRLFSGSPVKRTGRDRFVRNVLIAIGNSGDRALASSAEARLLDPSPLVRAMAVWALAQLLPRKEMLALQKKYLSYETDPDVLGEWHDA